MARSGRVMDVVVRLRAASGRSSVRFLLYLFLLCLLRGDSLNDPFYGDSVSYVMPTVFHQVDGTIKLYPTAGPRDNPEIDGGGHPFVFYHLLVLLLKLGLPPVLTCHMVMLVFAALVLLATDRIASALAGSTAGVAAAALMLVNPTFLAHAGIVLLEIPQTAFTLLTLWAALTGRWAWCAAFGSLAVLIKEPAVWILPPLGLYALFVGGRRGGLRRTACAAIPGLAFLAWMGGCKLATGMWINRTSIHWYHVGPMLRASELFYSDGRAALTAVAAGLVVWHALHRRRLVPLLVAVVVAAAAVVGLPSLQRSVPFVSASLPWVAAGIAAMAGGIGVVWGPKELLLWGAILAHLLIFTFLQETMPRYAFVPMALFPAIVVGAVWRLRHPLVRWALVIPGVAWAIASWNEGIAYDRGLRYREILGTIQTVATRLEVHHPHRSILWWCGGAYILRDPRYGYVSTPLEAYDEGRPPHVLPKRVMPEIVVCISTHPDMDGQLEQCRAAARGLARRFGAQLIEDYARDEAIVKARIYRLLRTGPRGSPSIRRDKWRG